MTFLDDEFSESFYDYRDHSFIQVSERSDPDYIMKADMRFLKAILPLSDEWQQIALEGYELWERQKLIMELKKLKK